MLGSSSSPSCLEGVRDLHVNLVPRAFSLFKMAIGETAGQGCQSGSKSSLEFHHANMMKCLCFVSILVSDCRKQTGLPDAGNNLRKRHFIMCHVIKYSTTRISAASARGFSDHHFKRGESPGDEVETLLLLNFCCVSKP